ncbi:hypothetical protein C8Q78DRAFT_1079353 [Trametes maxima]|nr:hypothetical protein C8Q78DRAFT_1079353 [Trametes maxima]
MPLMHRGYGAYISCDGRELEQLRAKASEKDQSASCYVCSDAGKDFRVHWVDSKPPTHLSVEIRVDGSRIGVVSHTKGSSKPATSGISVPLEDRNLARDEADDDALPSAYSEELGTVEVRLRRVRDFVTVPFVPRQSSTLGPSRERNAPAANRRGSTKSAVAERRPGTSAKATILRPILIDDKPYVVFRFFYRSKGVLEAKGILRERSGSSSRTSSSSSRKGHRKRQSTESPSTIAETQRPPSKRRRVSTGSEAPNSSLMGAEGPPPINREACAQQTDAWESPDQDMEPTVKSEWLPLEVPDPPEHLSMGTMSNDEEEEQVVEIHLSAQNGFAPLGSRVQSMGTVKSEPAEPVKLEHQPEDTSLPLSSTTRDYHAELKIEEEEEESVIKVRVNSRNRHIVFGAPRNIPQEPAVKKEDSPERDPTLGETQLVSVKCEDSEEDTVEVHISSRDIQRTFDRPRRDAIKAEG